MVASLRTRSSTFAIRTKPSRNPKIAKELALFPSHGDKYYELDNEKDRYKQNPAANKR